MRERLWIVKVRPACPGVAGVRQEFVRLLAGLVIRVGAQQVAPRVRELLADSICHRGDRRSGSVSVELGV